MDASRDVLSLRAVDVARTTTVPAAATVQTHRLGTVTAKGVHLSADGATVLDTDRAALATPYEETLPAAVS